MNNEKFGKQSKLIALSVLVGATTCLTSVASEKTSPVKKQRNILVILCDQLRPDFLNPYGFKAMETKGVNRLAKMGVVFDNCITASPVSGPARASMMTGLYISGHGVWTNDMAFNDGIDYLAKRMNQNGYETAAFGKMHIFPAEDTKGFKTAILTEENRLKGKDAYVQFLQNKYPDEKINSVFQFSKGLEFTKPMEDYYDYWICSNTIHFLNEYKEGKFQNNPFFVWMSLQGPHTPYDPPREMKGKVDASKIPAPIKTTSANRASVIEYRSISLGVAEKTDKQMADIRLAYAEKLKLEDEQIERVLDELQRLGLLDNTTIIFSADHGDELGDFGLDMKGPFPYSHQLNIPMIIANHPTVSKGLRSDILVSNLDIPGTCLDIAEDKKPLGFSRSVIEMLKPNSTLRREVIFSEFNDTYKSVEDKQYRYAYYPFEQKAMMFDKIKDPNFQNDLSGTTKYATLELKFLKYMIDFQCINKGFHVEAQDFTPKMQAGVAKIYPNWVDDFVVCYPLQYRSWSRLKEHGLDYKYNDFCIPKETTKGNSRFWEDPKYKNNK